MTDEASKDLAQHVLETFGYVVHDIPTVPDSRSADLFATCPDSLKPALIIEAKEKEPGPELARRRDEALRSGKQHVFNEALAEQSILNSVMSGAVDQVRSTQARYPDALRCVFIVCTGFNAESRFEQFRHRVAGIATVFELDGPIGECAFFRDSDLFRYRKILDSVILVKSVGDGLDASFYVNCYSARYSQMSENKSLQETLKEGFVDIATRDVNGDMWSLHDVAGNRSNETEMLNAVRDKYGLGDKVMTMQMKHAGVEMLVPRS
jgi:hypothetical protein